jgi:predicted nucleic acid-binding protein
LPLLAIEVANGLRFSFGLKQSQIAKTTLERFSQLPIEIVNLPNNAMENVLQSAYENETTIYDTIYHILAIARDATLLTCDKQYWRSAKHLKHIELLG